jgi:hypothetical protein
LIEFCRHVIHEGQIVTRRGGKEMTLSFFLLGRPRIGDFVESLGDGGK